MGRKNPVTVVVTGFSAPISKSVRNVGCGGGTFFSLDESPTGAFSRIFGADAPHMRSSFQTSFEPHDLRVSHKRFAFACPFAVPEMRSPRSRSAHFDRGTRFCLAVSATGGGRQRDPTSNARRTHNPSRCTILTHNHKKRTPQRVSFSYGKLHRKRYQG